SAGQDEKGGQYLYCGWQFSGDSRGCFVHRWSCSCPCYCRSVTGSDSDCGVNSVVTGITEAAVNNHHGKNAQSIFQRYMDDVGKILDCLEHASCEERLEGLDVVGMFGAGKLIPNIGQLARGTPLALSKSARAGFITLNALFIGLDVLFICKDSISLAKGSKSEISQLIRSRATLWKSELEAWQKIHDSLCVGIWRFRKSQEVLEQLFLP
ncbi:hypothetical protein M9458_006397, partial [Cirrhinus mrigala]